MIDPIETEEHQREEAFVAPPFILKGVTLQPFAIGRQSTLRLHCRRIGLPPMLECVENEDMFLPVAIRLLWFVVHEPKDWLKYWMAHSPAESAAALDQHIMDWADAAIHPSEAGAVIQLALDIWKRARMNQPITVDSDEEDAPGEGRGR